MTFQPKCHGMVVIRSPISAESIKFVKQFVKIRQRIYESEHLDEACRYTNAYNHDEHAKK